MKIENTKAQMRKGVLEYCILLTLYNQSAYASDIIKELKRAKLIVVEGTLYPLLTRLKNAELLSYKWVESLQGPPRKYYELTSEGVKFMHSLGESWSELNSAVSYIQTDRDSKCKESDVSNREEGVEVISNRESSSSLDSISKENSENLINRDHE